MTLIKFRRGTAAQWTAANPVLQSGEPGHETDTGKIKLGNGTSSWTSLPYFATDPGSRPISYITDLQATLDDLEASTSGALTLDRLPPGSAIVVDYYKPTFGASNAWPTVRPTSRVDIDVTWRGPTDPGSIMLVGDILDLTS